MNRGPLVFAIALSCGVLVAPAADKPTTTQPAATDTAAEMKIAEAMETAYRLGRITGEEFAPAVAIYERAAKAGDVEAMYSLACCYYAGKGVDVDVEAAIKWLAATAGKPHKDAHYFHFDLLWGQYEIRRVRPEAFKPMRDDWETLAMVGEPRATVRYGLMLEYGLGGVKPDKAEAVKMYQAAAEKQDPLGMYRLGRSHWVGPGGPAKDPAKSLQWIRRAAEADCPPALGFLGRCYLFGRGGVKKDPATGFRYALRAARLGHIRSMNDVADSLYFGDLGKPDYAGALEWATEAANLRSGRGLYRLGMIHIGGKGVPVDPARAAQCFLAGADAGYAKGCYKLGQCLELGVGLDADRAEAVRWYRKAARGGDKTALKRLTKLGVTP